MRRLVSREEEIKRRKRNQTILVGSLVFIMVLSSIGFAIQGSFSGGSENDPGNQVKYRDFTFINQNGLWILGNFVFQKTPQEVEDIGSGISLIKSYQGVPVYIYSENSGAEGEIALNLGKIALRIQRACPENVSCGQDIPTKTCSDNFIIIKESNISRIEQENKCVFIEGPQEELVGLTDQFLFKTLGIR